MVMFFENRNVYPYIHIFASVKPSPRRHEKNFLKKFKKTLDNKKRPMLQYRHTQYKGLHVL